MPDRTTETTPGERRRRFELLARERAGDKSVLWRVGAWAGVAITSAVVAAVVANSPTGARHGALLAANSLIADQHTKIQQLATINEREARRLANAVETLNSDRNRLFKRVTDLEHNLDTVTGSVSRFTAAPPAATQTMPPPANVSAPATQPAAQPAKADTTGSVATPKVEAKAEPRPDTKVASASIDVPKIEVIRIETGKTEPAKAETAKPEIAKLDVAKPESVKPEAAKSEPAKPEAKVETPKPDVAKLDPAKLDIIKPALAKPETAKTETPKADAGKTEAAKADTSKPEPAKAAAATPGKADDGPTGTVNQTQFGIDLGHASSIEGLRAIWAVTRKTHGALVDGLQPLISVREQSNGMGMQLRLLAGPMNDAAAAAVLCAKISNDDRPCRTAVYDGQRLAARGDSGMQTDSATPPRSSRPAKSTRPDRKPKAEAKSSGRFFPGIFAQP